MREDVRKRFGDNCLLYHPKDTGLMGLNLTVAAFSGRATIENIAVVAERAYGKIKLTFGLGGTRIYLGPGSRVNGDLRFWRPSTLYIGNSVSISGIRMIADDCDIDVQGGGLFSDEIILQGNDQHGIMDLTEMRIINSARRKVHVGEHVWVGRRAMILPDVSIGKGSIVGIGSIVTKDVPPASVVAGVPARVLRTNTSWSFEPGGPSGPERQFLEALAADLAAPEDG